MGGVLGQPLIRPVALWASLQGAPVVAEVDGRTAEVGRVDGDVASVGPALDRRVSSGEPGAASLDGGVPARRRRAGSGLAPPPLPRWTSPGGSTDRASSTARPARSGPQHIRALVNVGRIEDRELAEELVRILGGRREKILRRWRLRLSSLTDPSVEQRDGNSWLCLHDRAEEAGLGPPPAPAAVHWFSRETGAKLTVNHLDGGVVCAAFPGATGDTVVDVEIGRPGQAPLRVQLHDGQRVVGLERPEQGGRSP